MLIKQPAVIGGSGSSYLYGHFDTQFKPGMSKEEAVNFVTTCKFILSKYSEAMELLNDLRGQSLCLC